MKKKVLFFSSIVLLLGACGVKDEKKEGVTANELKANTTSVIDNDSEKVVMNGHEFEYDTMSGATVVSSRKDVVEMSTDDKEDKMFWTVQPPLGLIEGEYYLGEKEFNEGFIATADVVIDNDKIVHMELDEVAPADYYSEDWASEGKRRSGYAEFQASKDRTSRTLVTWVNGATFLEWQALKKNGLDINYETIFGASNSSRDAFIPLLKEMSKEVKAPSGKYYIGLTAEPVDGISSRLELIFEGEKIVKAKFDEIFADNKQDIADKDLQKYVRQSKYDSVSYNQDTKNEFRELADTVTAEILKEQGLNIETSKLNETDKERLEWLLSHIQPAVDKYLKEGYSSPAAKRALFSEKDSNDGYFQDKIKMSRLESNYDKKTENYHIVLEIENTSDKDYAFSTNKFYLYVHNKDNAYDTLTDEDVREITLKPKEKTTLALDINPVYTTDSDVSLVYDGNEEVYLRVEVPQVNE